MIAIREIKILARPATKKPKKRGDFDILVSKEHLVMFIPIDLYNLIIIECNAQNADGAIKYLCEHIGTVARFLHWEEDDVKRALRKLEAHINGVLTMPNPKTGPGKR